MVVPVDVADHQAVKAAAQRVEEEFGLFGALIDSGDSGQVAIGFAVGAAAMALGGLAELIFGVNAERRSLEDVATPLTAEPQPATTA